MNLPVLAALFTIYSAIGWLIDSAWRSYRDHQWERGGFSFLPLCPIYGFGSFLAIWLDGYLRGLPIVLEILLLGVIMATLEYAGGALWLKLFGRRLWKYDKTFMNIGGHTDLFHVFAWGLLAIFLVKVMHPTLLSLLTA